MNTIAYLGTGTQKDINDHVIVLQGKDPSFKVPNIMLSLAMQIKMRMEKEGTDREDKEEVAKVMKVIAERAGLRLLTRSEAMKETIEFSGIFGLDTGKVIIRNVPARRDVLLKNIGEVKVPENKVAKIAKRLNKLAK